MKKIWNCTLATFSSTMLKLSPKLLTINYLAGKKSGLSIAGVPGEKP